VNRSGDDNQILNQLVKYSLFSKKGKGKVLPYLLLSIGPRANIDVQSAHR